MKLASRDLQYLDLVIKEHANDKEVIPNLKKLETALPVLFVNVIAQLVNFIYISAQSNNREQRNKIEK